MKRIQNHIYYYIDSTGIIRPDIDKGSDTDKKRYEVGNYFDAYEARKAQAAFIALFKKQTFLDRVKNIIKI